ncbi:MAG: sulfite oxidase [Myxococcota bacterium]|nr:sulfite oxidase [Myxococcota bacterium]
MTNQHTSQGGTQRSSMSRRTLIQGGLAMALFSLFGQRHDHFEFVSSVHAGPRPPNLPSSKISGLTVLNERPLNIETPAHLLTHQVTPASHLFVRNNGIPPKAGSAEDWRLIIEGESIKKPVTFSIAELKARFSIVTRTYVLECAGNGRNEFTPSAKGNQWTTGAVGCVTWTGILLKALLEQVEMTSDAIYVAYVGADSHLSGQDGKKPISRGIPLKKAMSDDCMIAWSMNHEPIPRLHGYPLRLVVPGFPGSCSGKWLTGLLIRNKVHDGPKMGEKSYRIPCRPVAPGSPVEDTDMCIIEDMPVKSLITRPASGTVLKEASPVDVEGHAWSGTGPVAELHISVDFGQTWIRAKLNRPLNRYCWQQFRLTLPKMGPGYYEIWARATDEDGRSQPMVLPGWNPKGYLNNACHRVAIRIEAS